MLSNGIESPKGSSNVSNTQSINKQTLNISTPEARPDYQNSHCNQNDLRFKQIEEELRNIASYGSACDELLSWMSDNLVYDQIYEKALLRCLVTIRERATSFGVWSGLQILKKASENCGKLSSEAQKTIGELYAGLSSLIKKEKLGKQNTPSSEPVNKFNPTPSAYHNSAQLLTTNCDKTAKSTLNDVSLPAESTKNQSNSPAQSNTSSPVLQNNFNTSNKYNQRSTAYRSPSGRPPQTAFTNSPQFTPITSAQSHQAIYPKQFVQPLAATSAHYSPKIMNKQTQNQQSVNTHAAYIIPVSPTQPLHIPQQQTKTHLYGQQHPQASYGQRLAQSVASSAQSSPNVSQPAYQPQALQAQHQSNQQAPLKKTKQQLEQEQQSFLQQYLQQQAQERLRQQQKQLLQQLAQQQTQQQQAQLHLKQQIQQFMLQQAQMQAQITVANPQDSLTLQNTTSVQRTQEMQAVANHLQAATTTQLNNSSANSNSLSTPHSYNSSVNNQFITSSASKKRPLTFHLPNISQPIYDQLVLPKTNDLNQSKDENDPKDLALYARPCHKLLGPFNLSHGQRITDKQFYIGHNYFTRIYNENNNRVIDKSKQPLMFVFTAWHTKSASQKVDWPDKLDVEVNGRRIQLERKKPIAGRRNAYMGKDKPYDLKDVLREGINVLRLLQNDCACSYEFCVHLIVRDSENLIIEKTRNNPVTIEEGRAMVAKLLGNYDDEEITIKQTSIKGVECNHIDSFDLHDYLELNKTIFPNWECPICNKKCPPASIRHDLFFDQILKSLPTKAAEIEFKGSNGDIRIIKEDDDYDNDELIDDDNIKKEDETANDIQRVENTAEVIDLISDDEDDTNATSVKRPKVL
ncbi:hypothetical protein G6F57_002377 [Rhizopus arrhizus]|nr:hypothetical protein G6F30_001903 [Rhizopus arrhizus]KAG1424615.1 hypothetical protein G6F58_002298 [Rhizopus delemar]KAG0985821.1 hypothetical protein G6F29_003730 [Rhizopus arrhizus]KAG0999704.1 hypothetical protein G6F28_000759 [Rhizopus arrhizus]KAG1013341.1 hypothetical protein G6F27_001976 [Rhizopus arrhizus]